MNKEVQHIKAGKQDFYSYLKDAWNKRDIAIYLALRDIKVRYRETALGLLWAIIQPVATVLILSFVFSKISRLSTGDIPILLFAMAGYFVWGMLANNVSQTVHLLKNSRNMIKKVYFPRALLPTSGFILNSIESIVTLLLLALLWVYYGYELPHSFSIVFIAIMGTVIMSWGLSLSLSGINMRYRDFNYIIPVFLRLGLIITPIAFSITDVPENWSYLLYLNPATPFIELLRYGLWGTVLSSLAIYTSIAWAIVLPLAGLYFLNYLDSYIADIL